MKITKKNEWILSATVGLGVLGCWLRHMILTEGIDEKGLLIRDDPATIGLWALCLGYLSVAFFLARRQNVTGTFRVHFPQCGLRGALGMTGGAIIGLYGVLELLGGSYLTGIFGLLAGVSMIFTGHCRRKGRHPSPMFHVLVCLFFIIRLVLSFQNWSADPQVQDYVIQLLSSVSLMMFAYHRASFDANLPTPKRTVFFGLCAVFFTVVSLSDAKMWLFCLGASIWSVGAWPTLEPDDQPHNAPAHSAGGARGSQVPEELLAEISEKELDEALEKALSQEIREESVAEIEEDQPALEDYAEPDPALIAELFARLPEEERHPWA